MRAPTVLFVASLLMTASCQHATSVARSPQVAPVKCVNGNALDVASPEVLPAAALPLDGPDAIHPCKAKTPDWEAASKALEAFETRIAALADDGDAKPVKAELDALLTNECFALAAGDFHDATAFDSAVSLKAWWDDGGMSWLAHYLVLGDLRESVVPPSRRRALTAASPKAKTHPLAPLLCPPSNARMTDATGCGHETSGWVKRADASLVRRAVHGRATSTMPTVKDCTQDALAAGVAAEDRYAVFRACLDTVAMHRDALPLGRFKAPTDGWFVIAGGRRSSCIELFAYDLASGAAYRVRDCTGRGRSATAPATAIGRVPLALLREAVWMILLARVSEHDVLSEAATFAIPKEIPIGRPRNSGYGSTGGSGCGSSSPRSWSWMRATGGALVGQASGIIQWPSDGCTDVDGHAGELVEVMEDGFEAGCAPAAAPTKVPWSAPGPAIEHDHVAVLDDFALEASRTELARVAALRRPRCP
jgi:hypothetical protein